MKTRRAKTEERSPDNVRLVLTLYIAGGSPNSEQAKLNLGHLCRELSQTPDVEVVDLLQEPERALENNIIVTPTLVKKAPAPIQHVVGNLSDTRRVRAALGLGDAPSK